MRRTSLAAYLPFLVFILSILPFLGAVPGGFFWDDIQNLRDNSGFTALDWPHLRWMLTATWLGHYTPLVWLSFALDHALWGAQLAGWHATNLLLHAFNAVLFYFVSRRLLSPATRAEEPDTALSLAAAFSALLFSLHPLRVESVAWLTERRDVLSTAFLLACLLAYLRACEGGTRRFRLLLASLLLYECSLLSKESGVTLPAVLLVLDVYPLRRLGGAKGWSVGEVWIEKGLFFLAALPTLLLTPLRVYRSGSIVAAAKLGLLQRLEVFCYGLAFYARKTLCPSGLAPFYPFPKTEGEVIAAFGVAAAVVLLAVAAAILMRRRFPALGAAAAAYAIVLTPVAGLIQNGPQIAADRYSYVSCLPWALLAGGALYGALRRKPSVRAAAVAAAACLCAALGLATAAQAALWSQPADLWRRTAALFPNAALPEVFLAEQLAREGKDAQADAAYQAALRAEPLSATAHESYAGWFWKLGRGADAERELRRSMELNPNIEEAHELLGHVLEAQGRSEDAEREYGRAVSLKPDEGQALLDSGAMLLQLGGFAQAREELERAALLEPGSAPARYDLALALAGEGRAQDALGAYADAVRLDPVYLAARINYGNLLARTGRADAALEQYQAALRLDPDSAGAHYNLGALLEAQGDMAAARAEYQSALRARADYREAAEGLARVGKASQSRAPAFNAARSSPESPAGSKR